MSKSNSNRNRILGFALVIIVLVAAFSTMVAPAAANDTASCSTTTFTGEVVKDWVAAYLHISVEKITYFVFKHEVGSTIDVDVEYWSATGEKVIWKGTITLSDTCTPQFAQNTSGWTCDVSVMKQDVEAILASGEYVGVVMTYDEWYVSEGFYIRQHYIEVYGENHQEFDLYVYYYAYVVSVVGELKTVTRHCTAPGIPLVVLQGYLPAGYANRVHWQTRSSETQGWSNVLLSDNTVYYPPFEPRDRVNPAAPGGHETVNMVALVLGTNDPTTVTVANWRVVDDNNNEVRPSWVGFNCEYGDIGICGDGKAEFRG